MKRLIIVLLFGLIVQLSAQTSYFNIKLEDERGNPRVGKTVVLIPQESTYPNDSLMMVENPPFSGNYERFGVPNGEYKVYIDGQLFKEHYWIGEDYLSQIAAKFVDAKLIWDGLSDAVKDSIRAGTGGQAVIPDMTGDPTTNLMLALWASAEGWMSSINSNFEKIDQTTFYIDPRYFFIVNDTLKLRAAGLGTIGFGSGENLYLPHHDHPFLKLGIGAIGIATSGYLVYRNFLYGNRVDSLATLWYLDNVFKTGNNTWTGTNNYYGLTRFYGNTRYYGLNDFQSGRLRLPSVNSSHTSGQLRAKYIITPSEEPIVLYDWLTEEVQERTDTLTSRKWVREYVQSLLGGG